MEEYKNLKRSKWSTGRVVKVYPGEDGLVRAVDVQLGNGIYRRGIRSLCLLERSSTGQDSKTAQPASGENVPAKAITAKQ